VRIPHVWKHAFLKPFTSKAMVLFSLTAKIAPPAKRAWKPAHMALFAWIVSKEWPENVTCACIGYWEVNTRLALLPAMPEP